ncbi:uncharacterized protein LOC123625644 [Lemur catta]|uniref:uncharacterized protein LOC123625644 n=1 Tax=Lemur catta TaxID=9447 RepID=UPI001E269877|nr:uncharacterized protein LOC123625644 [Lemur catta]
MLGLCLPHPHLLHAQLEEGDAVIWHLLCPPLGRDGLREAASPAPGDRVVGVGARVRTQDRVTSEPGLSVPVGPPRWADRLVLEAQSRALRRLRFLTRVLAGSVGQHLLRGRLFPESSWLVSARQVPEPPPVGWRGSPLGLPPTVPRCRRVTRCHLFFLVEEESDRQVLEEQTCTCPHVRTGHPEAGTVLPPGHDPAPGTLALPPEGGWSLCTGQAAVGSPLLLVAPDRGSPWLVARTERGAAAGVTDTTSPAQRQPDGRRVAAAAQVLLDSRYRCCASVVGREKTALQVQPVTVRSGIQRPQAWGLA